MPEIPSEDLEDSVGILRNRICELSDITHV